MIRNYKRLVSMVLMSIVIILLFGLKDLVLMSTSKLSNKIGVSTGLIEIEPYENDIELHNGINSVDFKVKEKDLGIIGSLFVNSEVDNVYVTLKNRTLTLSPEEITFKVGTQWQLKEKGSIKTTINGKTDKSIQTYIISGPESDLIKLASKYTKVFDKEISIK